MKRQTRRRSPETVTDRCRWTGSRNPTDAEPDAWTPPNEVSDGRFPQNRLFHTRFWVHLQVHRLRMWRADVGRCGHVTRRWNNVASFSGRASAPLPSEVKTRRRTTIQCNSKQEAADSQRQRDGRLISPDALDLRIFLPPPPRYRMSSDPPKDTQHGQNRTTFGTDCSSMCVSSFLAVFHTHTYAHVRARGNYPVTPSKEPRFH